MAFQDFEKEKMDEFDEYIKNAKKEVGEIPDNTCPSIDKLVNQIDNYVEQIEYLKKSASRYENIEELVKDFPDTGWNGLTSDLDKKLRYDNEKLREIGKFWYEQCKEVKSSLLTSLRQSYALGKEESFDLSILDRLELEELKIKIEDILDNEKNNT